MRVLGKELRVSAIVGAVLGIVNGLRIYNVTIMKNAQGDRVIIQEVKR